MTGRRGMADSELAFFLFFFAVLAVVLSVFVGLGLAAYALGRLVGGEIGGTAFVFVYLIGVLAALATWGDGW